MSKRARSGSHGPTKLPQKTISASSTNEHKTEEPSTAAYVDYALDMMAHNLVSAGKLDPRKAPQLKTEEMRSQIRARLEVLQKPSDHSIPKEKRVRPTHSKVVSGGGLPVAKPKRWAVQPNSLPIAIITDKKPRDEDFPSQKSQRKSKFLGKASIGVGISVSHSNNLQSTRSSMMSKSGIAMPLKTAVQFQKIPDRKGRSRSFSANPSGSKAEVSKSKEKLNPGRKSQVSVNAGNTSSHKSKEHTKSIHTSTDRPSGSKLTFTVQGRKLFRASLDMKGFLNEEISLDLDDHKLTVTGIRGRRDDLNARRVTETLDLPPEVNVDRLKIARRADGFLILQESTQAPP